MLASSPLTHTCPACGVTDRPILETFAAGPGLVAAYNQATGAHLSRGEEVLAAAARDNQTAIEIVRHAATATGVSIGWLVNVLDPQAVLLGGGLGLAEGLYHTCLIDAIREHIWSPVTRELPIVSAELGADAGFIGAALAAAKGVYA